MAVLDRHGEPLEVHSRVMLDGALVGTVVALDEDAGTMRVSVDGNPNDINQAMRAAQGQPN